MHQSLPDRCSPALGDIGGDKKRERENEGEGGEDYRSKDTS